METYLETYFGDFFLITVVPLNLAIAVARDKYRCHGAAQLPGPQSSGPEHAAIEWVEQQRQQ